MIYVLAALATVLACELAVHLPFGRTVSASLSTARKSLAVIQSPRISDHWKSRAVLHYSGQLMTTTLELSLMCGALLGAVALVGFAGHFFRLDLFRFLVGLPGLGTMTGVSVLYIVGRRRWS